MRDSSASTAFAPSPGSALPDANVPLHAKSSSHVLSFRNALTNGLDPGLAVSSSHPSLPMSRRTAPRAMSSFWLSPSSDTGLIALRRFFVRSSGNGDWTDTDALFAGRGRTGAW